MRINAEQTALEMAAGATDFTQRHLQGLGAVAELVGGKVLENRMGDFGKPGRCRDQISQHRLGGPCGNRDLGVLDTFAATDILEDSLVHDPRVTCEREVEYRDERRRRWQLGEAGGDVVCRGDDSRRRHVGRGDDRDDVEAALSTFVAYAYESGRFRLRDDTNIAML